MIFNYITSVLLIVLGLYTVCAKRNLIKIVLGLGITDYGINMLIVSIGYNYGGTAPIYAQDLFNVGNSTAFVDPVPQARTLTSIVISACVDAMALALVIMINKRYKSIDANEIRRLKG